MSSKKRKWSDEYAQYGFTCITERDGSQHSNCMICNAKLSNSSLAPAKLREHFLKLHGKYKNITLAEFKVKRARFDEKAPLPVLGFVPINKPILTALYEVAYLIAKQGKPHTIGETLIKPDVLKMANIMLGKAAEVKLSQIPLSNDTISDRIEDMSKDILAQVVANLISSPAKFSLQLDETTDFSNLSQFAVFVRYVKDDVIKEDFLFCKPLTTTTKAADVKKLVDDFFKDNNLSWDMVSAVCSDGAPAMLGRKSGFGALVKADAPHIIVTHCILHRRALATKMLPPKLAEVLKIVVECVNYVQNSALRHRIFRELCKEMGSEFAVLLYHSHVRWLSRGQVLNRVFSVRVELARFLQENQHFHADCFKNSEFILILAYMADIFAALNHLNVVQMQGGGVNIIEAEENLKAFQKKLPLWKRRTENDNFANFPPLDDCQLHSRPSIEAFNFRNGLQTTNPRSTVRSKRTTEHHITECIYMTSDEGEFYHEAATVDGTACGVYIFSEPDQRIEIHFNYLDVPCENGGLVSFVDGWELNGQFFPSPADHPRPMQSRFSEFCGKRKIKQVFSSSQNVALIQYRMPERGRRFSFSVRFLKNPTPCNTLLQSTEDIFTLRNYGKRVNCSISTLFPAAVRVAALSVGVVPSSGRGIELETGTLHKCQKRGLDDYVQIGGSAGLDNSDLLLADTVCGIDSKPAKQVDLIGCGTTTVRLISSGAFDNSITVALRQMNEDDVTNGYMSVFCPPEDMLE